MTSSDTLLAFLVSSFPGNTENIATEALSHVFHHSDASMEALNDVVRSGVPGIAPITDVKTQVIGADGTQPDLVGFDETCAERVLIEVKFWAALTAAQPNRYIERLPEDGPAVLVFLVPEERIQWLWPQLKDRLKDGGYSITETDFERKSIRLGETEKHLMIASWGGILDSMAARTVDYGELGFQAEIRQLRSLTKYADEGAFKPIRQAERGADELRKRQYRRLVDAATDEGIKQGWASRKHLRATPRRYGYGRYVSLDGYNRAIVWFGINLDRFEETGDTPLWVSLSSKLLKRLETKFPEVCDALELQDTYWIPVELKRNVEYPEVLDGVVESLKKTAEVLQRAGKSS